jgi:Asp-tRNA(Asn)/Glu-tRNA(Gln) amidotransferase A subunit family amidase
VELVKACLNKIAADDDKIGAWVKADPDGALAVAEQRASEAVNGQSRGPLHGIPIAIKDIINVAGMTTTCGAGKFAHLRPMGDAECVARLRAAGAIILGKVTTTEFTYFEPAETRNPWNTAHTPGGSSSGSAAAVADRMAPMALGTQTIGSILRPAAFCGIVGFKGTHGSVPAEGVFPMAPSLDHVGVLARCVADVRVGHQVLSGYAISNSSAAMSTFLIAPELIERADVEVALRIRIAMDRFMLAGGAVREIRLPPSFSKIHEAGQAILEYEFAAQHRDLYQTNAASYRPRTRQLIATGLSQPENVYEKAQQVRDRFRAEMQELLGLAVLISPTAAGVAPEGIGYTGDPWFCAPWSSIGFPAIAMPISVGSEGLPHSIQLVANRNEDLRLLSAAAWAEGIIGFSFNPPPRG